MIAQTTLDCEQQAEQQADWQREVARLMGPQDSLPRDPERLLQLGQAYLKGRLTGPAEDCFRTALAVDPELTRAHFYLGYLYSRQGRYREAEVEFGKCLASQPRNGSVYAELGLVYFKQGQIREARGLWQQGLLLADEGQRLSELLEHMSFSVTLDGEERVVPNLCRMASLVGGEDHELACSYLERALQLEPFNPAVFVNYAQVLAGAGKKHEAEEAWQEAVRLAPADANLQAGLAEFLLAQGRYKEARIWAERATMLAPREAGYRLLLAQAEVQAGNLTAAEHHLKVAHRLEPDSPSINYELGSLLWQERKIPAALSFLHKAAREGHKEAKAYLALACQWRKRRTTSGAEPDAEGGTAVGQATY